MNNSVDAKVMEQGSQNKLPFYSLECCAFINRLNNHYTNKNSSIT